MCGSAVEIGQHPEVPRRFVRADTRHRPATWRIGAKAAALALAAAAALPAPARAGSAGSTGVSATVVDSCRFVDVPEGALPPAFTPQAGDASTSLTVQFRCTRTTPYRFEVDAGRHFDSGTASRQLRGPDDDDAIAYSLELTPGTGEGRGSQLVTATVTAIVRHADYEHADPGTYSDVVGLTLRDARSGKVLAHEVLPLRLSAPGP
ncbi:MAG: spore coat protein U domain-containing protein [Burkholderiaceae bacterium]|nr:spore coat protein U domain-containing protein [Burkholderiaceae bacterium]